MKILGIETSCDETGVAIIEDGRKILSNVVASSREMHDKTGGVIPEMAAREQVKCMIPVLNETITNLKYKISNIDAIAVTKGPGLIGPLLVGVETAKTIAFVTSKPIIPVNHIFAHIYANFLDTDRFSTPHFPAIALVVSGGHTELFYMKDEKHLHWLGGTLDDAAGEAFDKTARLLGLGYPGGPAIAAEAEKFILCHPQIISGSKIMKRVQHDRVKLPRPMIESKDLNFSFSGLKTAVMREVAKLRGQKKLDGMAIQQLSFEIQEAITDVLVKKTINAVKKMNVKSILLGGGVAANRRLTEKFKFEIKDLKLKISLQIPQPKFCTDNGATIAAYAFFRYTPVPWKNIEAQPDLEVEV